MTFFGFQQPVPLLPSHFSVLILPLIHTACGVVVQLVRTLACHVRGRGFESRRLRHLDLQVQISKPLQY